MTPEAITNLVVNIGFAGTVAIFFIWRDSQRQNTEAESRTELEMFIRNTLMRVIEDSSAEKKETHILFEKCVDSLDRCVGILEKVER